MERLQLDYVDVLQCRVYWSSVLRLLKLMFERAFVGHRFDKETPIPEIVRGSTYEVDGIMICLNLRCKRFMMSFKLATYATSECLPAGHGNVCVSFCVKIAVLRFIECAVSLLHSPCNAK